MRGKIKRLQSAHWVLLARARSARWALIKLVGCNFWREFSNLHYSSYLQKKEGWEGPGLSQWTVKFSNLGIFGFSILSCKLYKHSSRKTWEREANPGETRRPCRVRIPSICSTTPNLCPSWQCTPTAPCHARGGLAVPDSPLVLCWSERSRSLPCPGPAQTACYSRSLLALPQALQGTVSISRRLLCQLQARVH